MDFLAWESRLGGCPRIGYQQVKRRIRQEKDIWYKENIFYRKAKHGRIRANEAMKEKMHACAV